MRQHADDDWQVALMSPYPGRRAEREAGEHIGLPVRLHFHARHGVVRGQDLERPDRRMVMTVLEHIGRDDGANLRHLAAREAAAAAEPLVRVVGVAGSLAAKETLGD